MSKKIQYKFTDPQAVVFRKNFDVPYRYLHRRFELVSVYGDYGIFTNPDRKKPFIIDMKLMSPV